MSNPRVTHQQIADKLGVSRTLVTGVLHGTGRFGANDQTRLKIETMAREMGYRPRNVTTHAIAYVFSPGMLYNHIEANFVILVEQTLRERGYRMTLVNPDVPAGQELQQVINPKTVDGVILTHWEHGRFASLLSPQMPCVVLSEEDDVDANVEQIGAHLPGTAENALRYLSGFGHRRVATFVGTDGKPFFQRLDRAVHQAAENLNWPHPVSVYSGRPDSSGPKLLELLAGDEPPTAVMTADIEHATVICCQLLAAGYRIPADISVLSLFDSRHSVFLRPQLSAMSTGSASMAIGGVRRLLEKIEMPETIPQHVFLPGEIVERGSVGPAKVR